MSNSPVDQLTTVVEDYEKVLAGVGADQWDAPTPCPEWTVRELANHVQRGNVRFAAIMAGEPADVPDADLLGEQPVAAFRDAADAMLVAFGQPGALERVVAAPIGQVPGVAALYLRVVEHLVHGWDLARATGQRPAFDDRVAEQAFAFTESKLADLPPGSTAFAARKAVAEDAPAVDRLAALLGREVR